MKNRNSTQKIKAPTPNQNFLNNVHNQKGNVQIVVGLVLSILVVAIGLYYFGTKKNGGNFAEMEPSPQITTITPTEVDNEQALDVHANWQTYTNKEFSYSFKHSPEYEVTDNGKNSVSLSKKNTKPDGAPASFIFIGVIPSGFQSTGGDIYNYNTKEANIILGMKIGETKSLREGSNNPALEKAISYTRLPDTKIGGLTAKSYLNQSPWEFPQGIQEYRYYVDKGSNTYMIGGYVEEKNPPQVNYISKEEFQQILSTFKFE